jgi:guanosine-3',5'-bis(diphosphate) 3'-pyrophosphohydrolase
VSGIKSRSNLGGLFYALAFAADKHRAQRRKDKEASPYINHPIALADVLVNEGGVDDMVALAAAVLHDTIEDTETSYEELRQRFGKEIADVVLEVTDDKSLPKAERKKRQVCTPAPRGARLVKLADKICNLRDIVTNPPADWPLERKQEYYEWAKRVIDGLRGAHAGLERIFDREYARKPA